MEMADFDKKETVRFLESPGSFNAVKGGGEDRGRGEFRQREASSVRLHKLVNEWKGVRLLLDSPTPWD